MSRPITWLIVFAVVAALGCRPLIHPAAVEPSVKRKLFMPNHPPEFFFDGLALELARAIDANDADRIRRLSPQVDLNRLHKQDMTFLFYALLSKRHAAVTALIKSGANPKQVDKELGSPLDLAVQASESKSLESILDGGIGPNERNSWGTPLLFTAACLDSEENLRLLVARKADLDATDKDIGRTAVFEAVSKRCYDQAIYLIENGARTDVTTVNGLTLAYSVQWDLERHSAGSPGFEKLARLKRLMEERGIKFPAASPPEVRAKMKSKGAEDAK